MTILYLSLRTTGILYFVASLLSYSESPLNFGDGCRVRFSTTLLNSYTKQNSCTIFAFLQMWLSFVINAILDVIIIARLHAMYQQSRKMLVFLTAIFLAVTISCGVITGVLERDHFSYEEYTLSGTYQCVGNSMVDYQFLIATTWILGFVWELLALFLAIWITVKRPGELRRWKIEDRFLALMKTQVLYFAVFVATTCLNLGSMFSPMISTSDSVGVEVYSGTLVILQFVQMFMLGPRLILDVREYNANLVANSDTDIGLQSLLRSAYTTSRVAVKRAEIRTKTAALWKAKPPCSTSKASASQNLPSKIYSRYHKALDYIVFYHWDIIQIDRLPASVALVLEWYYSLVFFDCSFARPFGPKFAFR
ncbi:hypothetical protein BDR07DRAFT_1495803 [Suillus spraguei]|nr:hypothetical protein BDR07DRAFT_1495803 [Suillus spraguei]